MKTILLTVLVVMVATVCFLLNLNSENVNVFAVVLFTLGVGLALGALIDRLVFKLSSKERYATEHKIIDYWIVPTEHTDSPAGRVVGIEWQFDDGCWYTNYFVPSQDDEIMEYSYKHNVEEPLRCIFKFSDVHSLKVVRTIPTKKMHGWVRSSNWRNKYYYELTLPKNGITEVLEPVNPGFSQPVKVTEPHDMVPV